MKDRVLNARYEVVQELGKNAGRQTLLARDLKTQELVVVKLLLFSNDFEWQDIKLFEREAETLKAISHRAIPSYLNYFELDSPNGKGFALVQTYVEGKSLDEHLKAGRTFSEVEVKEIAIALLSILIYLHGRQPPVIHRDIKPSNILLTNCSGNSVGEVHLVDFGSVQTLAAKEGGTITVVGTYGYMPPEQFGGRTVPASDLYSLGATLIALVTGSHPADLPQKDGRIQFEQVANLSPAFANWLRCMCEPSLDRRSTSAFEALQALEQEQLTKNSAPLVVHKPPGSKILLTKDANSLEILIPAKGLNSDTGLWFFIALLYSTVLPGLIILSGIQWYFLDLPQPIAQSIFYVLFGSWMFTFLKAIDLLVNTFIRVRLRINQQKFFFTHEMFDEYKSQNFRGGLRQAISHLEYVKRSFKKGYRGKLQCQIIVWIGGTQTFTLGNYGRLTEPELDWLAYELSDWLKLPIITE